MRGGSADGCSESYAHPEVFRGGKCARVKKWQKDAQPEWLAAESGARDLPEARQDADVTDAFPATRAFPAGEPPMSGTPSGGSSGTGAGAESGADGAGWFGSPGRPTRRHAVPDADETEARGSRIGDDRDHHDPRGDRDAAGWGVGGAVDAGTPASAGHATRPRHAAPDPMARGRITWGQTDRAGAGADRPGQPGAAADRFIPRQPGQDASRRRIPQQSDPNRTAAPRDSAPGRPAPGQSVPTRPVPSQDGRIPNAAPTAGDRTEVLPAATDRTEILPAGTDRAEALPTGTDRTEVLPAATDRTEILPAGTGSSVGSAATAAVAATGVSAAPDADRTDVLPQVPLARQARQTPQAPHVPPVPPEGDRTDVLPSVAPVAPVASASPTRVIPTAGPGTAPLRDPWQQDPGANEDADAGDHTHDPHEVTVQLDAVQLGDGVIRRADSGHRKGKAGPEASDGPVFVDSSGRRSRLYRRLGILVGIACAVYAVVIVSTLLSGNSDAPWLPVPGQEEGKPAGQVDTTPLPSESAQPSATGTATAPADDPSASTGVTTAPGSDTPAAGTSGATGGATGQPGTSTGPESPAAGGTDPDPGGSAGTGRTDPDPGQSSSEQPGSTGPSAPTGDGDASTDPTAPSGNPTGTDAGAGGTNANGVSDQSLSLSPENTL